MKQEEMKKQLPRCPLTRLLETQGSPLLLPSRAKVRERGESQQCRVRACVHVVYRRHSYRVRKPGFSSRLCHCPHGQVPSPLRASLISATNRTKDV